MGDAARRPAPVTPSLADVLRALHRGRLVLFDPRTCGESSAARVHDRAAPCAADRAAVRHDVLLALEIARPSAADARGSERMNGEINPQRYARAGGVLYLIIIVLGIIEEAFIRGRIAVAGDAAATFANLRKMAVLWRAGV